MAIDEDEVSGLRQLPEGLENRGYFAKAQQPGYVGKWRRCPGHRHFYWQKVGKTHYNHCGNRFIAFPQVGNVDASDRFGFTQAQISSNFSSQRSL